MTATANPVRQRHFLVLAVEKTLRDTKTIPMF